jgi:hypothetical protein
MAQQTQTTSTAGSLDQDAVNLAKAIRQVESGGDFSATGRSGEFGAYQFTQPTWNSASKKYGVNTPLSSATKEQQNEVAYKQIKEWKDSGYNPGQIASMWNSGKPDAYLDPNYTGTNKQGVKFDVPAYAKSVATAYHTIKGGGEVGIDPNNPSSTAAPQDNQSFLQKAGGFLGGLAKNITEPVATMIARPYQLASSLINPNQTDDQLANVPGLSAIYGKMPVPNNTQDLAKDVGRGAQTVALGINPSSFIGAVGMGALSGAGAGLEETGTAGGALKGGLVGTALGAVGGGISKLLQKIPTRITQDAFKGMKSEEVQRALATKTIGTKASLLKQSQVAVNEFGRTIDDMVAQSPHLGAGSNALQDTLQQFPEYAGKNGLSKLMTKVKPLIPDEYFGKAIDGTAVDRSIILQYIDRVVNGTANLFEKNKVRSALDMATEGSYNRLARSLNPTLGHGVAMRLADSLRNEVQTAIPETIPIFSEFAKEMGIKAALNKVVNKTAGGLIRWSDVIPFLTGNALGGPVAGLAGIATQRVAQSPAAQFAGAKAIQGVGKGLIPITSRAGLIPSLSPKSSP